MAIDPNIQSMVAQTANSLGIDPATALAQAQQESNFDPMAVSPAGAAGVMQLMPDTAKELGVTDVHDPQQNITGGLTYYKRLLNQYGDPDVALAAYNYGPGNINKWIANNGDFSDLPKETQNYVTNINSKKNSGSNGSMNTQSIPDTLSDDEINKYEAPNTMANVPQTLSDDEISKYESTSAPESQDNSGLAPVIGSTANSILGGISTMPGAREAGAVLGGLANSGVNAFTNATGMTRGMPTNPLTNISQAYSLGKQNQQAAQAANPKTFAAADIAANTVPFLATGGLGTGARIAANAAIGGSEALEHGSNPVGAGVAAAIAGPGAEFVGAPLNYAGNKIVSAGGHLGDALKSLIPGSKEAASGAGADFDQIVGLKNFDNVTPPGGKTNPWFTNTLANNNYGGDIKKGLGASAAYGIGSVLPESLGGVVKAGAEAEFAYLGAKYGFGGASKLVGTPFAQLYQNIYNDANLTDQQKQQKITVTNYMLQNDPSEAGQQYRTLLNGKNE